MAGRACRVARDIEAITVNRWPHGYAYGHDPETGQFAWMLDELLPQRSPWVSARKTFGRIAIANSDATADALSVLGRRMGRTPVTVKDSPGFLVNMGGRAYTTEGLRLAHEQVATPAQNSLLSMPSGSASRW